ncbi:MAG: serine hydrolase, partial [Acidobacteria bacterium]|nr:serine hydrolase [Acidobacteriota bacterium]
MRPVGPAWLAALGTSVAFLLGPLVARPIVAAIQETAPPPGLEERVDALFADYDNTRSPGCSLGIVRGGELTLARGYGMANLEHGVPLTARSIFRIGSTSKQFTAASIVLLAQEGKLRLDEDLRDHLPEMPGFDPPVTLRQLLHHTSVYRDYLTLMSIAGRRGDDFYTDADVLGMLSRQRELNFPPGNEYLYSNSGYWLLSQVVLRASDRSLREYAEARIFSPLAMNDTHFHDDHAEIVPNRASGYRPTEGGAFRISMTTLPMVGDGGVFTSVEDLTRWDRNFYTPVVGGSAFVEQMLERGVLNDGTVLDYALGLG